MDYYDVGQRIRKIRKARGLSQEQLAEKVGISTTHMSHIETANTKLSLPVFVDIAFRQLAKKRQLDYRRNRRHSGGMRRKAGAGLGGNHPNGQAGHGRLFINVRPNA